MKTMRKIMAVVLTFAMVLSLGITAFAEGTTYTITINNTVTGYEYEAYQVFKGDLKDSTLSNIAWGSGVNDVNLLAALKADTENFQIADPSDSSKKVNAFAGATSAAAVAAILDENTGFAEAFADIAGANLATKAAASTEKTKADGDKTVTEKYEISVSAVGYYLVKNSKVPAGADNTAATDFILEVVKSVTVDPKASVPSLNKTIGDTAKANAAGVGEVVNFKVVGSMPETLSTYNTYYYKFVDTLSKGLTYNGDLKITLVNGTDKKNITQAFKGGFSKGTGDTTVLQYAITDILALNLIKDKDTGASTYPVTATSQIIFEYSATVNKDAVVGVTGNPNTANLVYSNDPTKSGTPTITPPSTPPSEPPTPPVNPPEVPNDPDENPPDPVSGTPTGETPDSVTVTYVTGIKVKKIDGETKAALAGAAFTITGPSTLYQYTATEQFTSAGADDTATHWKLADGTYTSSAPNEKTLKYYETGTTTATEPSYVAKQTIKTVAKKEYVEYTAYTADANADDCSMSFSGLGAGKYTIAESTTPSGYNTAPDTEITITFTPPTTVTADAECTWAADGATYNATTGMFEVTVENNKGSVLPSTGGIGTTLFYAVGAVLVIGAGVLFITKKRMSGAED